MHTNAAAEPNILCWSQCILAGASVSGGDAGHHRLQHRWLLQTGGGRAIRSSIASGDNPHAPGTHEHPGEAARKTGTGFAPAAIRRTRTGSEDGWSLRKIRRPWAPLRSLERVRRARIFHGAEAMVVSHRRSLEVSRLLLRGGCTCLCYSAG